MKSNKSKQKDIIKDNKIFGWIALATVAILAIPFSMMQFSANWNWSLTDFVTIGILLFGSCSVFVFVARNTPLKYRNIIVTAFILGILYIWAELAVGIFTNIGS
jgi:uncharacterized membrane protein YesL